MMDRTTIPAGRASAIRRMPARIAVFAEWQIELGPRRAGFGPTGVASPDAAGIVRYPLPSVLGADSELDAPTGIVNGLVPCVNSSIAGCGPLSNPRVTHDENPWAVEKRWATPTYAETQTCVLAHSSSGDSETPEANA